MMLQFLTRKKNKMMELFADSDCELGEGPFWHPFRQSLFWFDILGKRLYTKGGELQYWQFEEYVSAAAVIDESRLLIASQSQLFLFDLETETQEKLCDLEADNPVTRSNDGRVDIYGGLWIGTMGIHAEEKAGAIYRFYRGELRQLFGGLTIPNSICFSPDGQYAYFTDTPTGIIKRVTLDADGWPNLETVCDFIDLRDEGLNPDGAIVDQDGHLWNAQWGASRVACYDQDGKFIRAVSAPSPHTSCPAFGGKDLNILFVTTAQEGLSQDQIADTKAGSVFTLPETVKGQAENLLKL